jgi:hypothetical protein
MTESNQTKIKKYGIRQHDDNHFDLGYKTIAEN